MRVAQSLSTLCFGFVLVGGVLATACGGGSSSAADAAEDVTGFVNPTAPVHANMETTPGKWMDLGPADLTCLNTPTADLPRGLDVTLNTTVLDFEKGKPVKGAMVTAFLGVDTTNPMAGPATSDVDGKVSLVIPGAGNPRIGFKMAGGAQGTDTQLDTYLLNQYLTPSMAIQTSPELLSVSNSTAMLLPALINQIRTAGSGVLAGAFRDCQNREVSNFIATVSSSKGSATLLAGASTYYLSATSTPLPQRHNVLGSSSGNGLFVVLQLPATPTAYVQMWGFKTDADVTSNTLTLLAELQVPVISDTVVTGSYQPLRQ